MSQSSKRLSFSMHETPIPTIPIRPTEASEWAEAWSKIPARDLIDSRIVSIAAEQSVETACELLLSESIPCLAVGEPPVGLFDFADVNSFLTVAATRHTFLPEYLRANPSIAAIESAARAGPVRVSLVSNLSEKNPLCTLPHDANIKNLLEAFSGGAHRVLIESPSSSIPGASFMGIVSDRGLLTWLSTYAERTPSFQQYLTASLDQLNLPSLNIYADVVSCSSGSSILDAMKVMSDQGVSSVAVLDEATGGTLVSAVSVTDVGKIIVRATSNHILSTSLSNFVSLIKGLHGYEDGEDRIPVFAVPPKTSLSYAIQKLLATNAHRLFVTTTADQGADLTGIISVVDILSLFAHLAGIPNVDPRRMQRHRRASSSTSSSNSSRSSSRASVRRMAGSSGCVGISPSHQTSFLPQVTKSPVQGPPRALSGEFEWAVRKD